MNDRLRAYLDNRPARAVDEPNLFDVMDAELLERYVESTLDFVALDAELDRLEAMATRLGEGQRIDTVRDEQSVAEKPPRTILSGFC